MIDKEVHSPDHYTHGGIETRDYLIAKLGTTGYIDYCYGNVLKYVSRAKYKGKEVQDLEKARWYIEDILEILKCSTQT
jgi:hypothetical protein